MDSRRGESIEHCHADDGRPFQGRGVVDRQKGRGCMELSFMHPRLLRDVPFRDVGVGSFAIQRLSVIPEIL